MLAFEEMMKKSIVMPAHLMDDNEHAAKNGRNLFADFSEVAQVRSSNSGSPILLLQRLLNLATPVHLTLIQQPVPMSAGLGKLHAVHAMTAAMRLVRLCSNSPGMASCSRV